MRSLRSAGPRALLFISLIPAVLGLFLSGCKNRDGVEGPMTDPQVVYERAQRASCRSRISTSRLRSVSSLSVVSAPPSASRLTTRTSVTW